MARRSRVLVMDRTWLQLMCCTPSRSQCPNFRGQGYIGKEVRGYGDGAGANLELAEL